MYEWVSTWSSEWVCWGKRDSEQEKKTPTEWLPMIKDSCTTNMRKSEKRTKANKWESKKREMKAQMIGLGGSFPNVCTLFWLGYIAFILVLLPHTIMCISLHKETQAHLLSLLLLFSSIILAFECRPEIKPSLGHTIRGWLTFFDYILLWYCYRLSRLLAFPCWPSSRKRRTSPARKQFSQDFSLKLPLALPRVVTA